MSLCIDGRCQLPSCRISGAASPNPGNSNSIEIGDILTICAAADLPLFKQIKDDQSLKSKATQVFASSEYSRMVQNSLSNPPIPCIVVSLPSAAKDDKLMVCLMREITEKQISELATMVQHFLLPIHRDRFNLADHLHTSPEWPNGTSQWVVTAFPIEAPEGSLRGHFQTREVARYQIGRAIIIYNNQLGDSSNSQHLRETMDAKKRAKPKKGPTNTYLMDDVSMRNDS
ncbi:hypothetical protein HWV62_443 [Athelia sp. TMB]|nr:hypothetical protein HWV62_443 [Athelia sp. TMB]